VLLTHSLFNAFPVFDYPDKERMEDGEPGEKMKSLAKQEGMEMGK